MTLWLEKKTQQHIPYNGSTGKSLNVSICYHLCVTSQMGLLHAKGAYGYLNPDIRNGASCGDASGP